MHIWKFGRVDMHRYGYEILDDTYTQSIVKWVVYGEPEWKLESTRKGWLQRHYQRKFWTTSGKSSSKEFCADPVGKHRLTLYDIYNVTVCTKAFKREQYLGTHVHRTKTKHYDDK